VLPVRLLCVAAALLAAMFPLSVKAQAQSNPPDTPTFRATSRLVVLDVTVLDSKGRPVVKGLTQDDFIITESKKQQQILSFEAPESHVTDVNAADANPRGKAPLTIFVLDLLNSKFEDFAYIRYEVRKYLTAESADLKSPAELMVLGNRSLEMVQGFTRNKQDLLYALDHVPAALPFKQMNGSFFWERFAQSIDALQQIALQNNGVPGRKNIVWVGHGGPSVFTESLGGSIVNELNQYVHDTTNMLVDARISLFVIYPKLKVQGGGFGWSEMSADADIGEDDPFSGDINFGVFVKETGGNLFFNRNDIDSEIRRSQQLGSEYYTLSYRPPEERADGKFRRIRVNLRNPGLRLITKAGYFAPEEGVPVDPRQQMMVNIAEAVRSTIPFQSLDLAIENVVRYPDSGRVEFVVVLKPRDVAWQATDDGKSTVKFMLAAASLTKDRNVLASKVETATVLEATQDPAQLSKALTRIQMRLRVPKETQSVRVVVQTSENGRLGTIEVDRRSLDASPEAPTPEKLLLRPSEQGTRPSGSPK
jgi:VWFA-related protein